MQKKVDPVQSYFWERGLDQKNAGRNGHMNLMATVQLVWALPLTVNITLEIPQVLNIK